MKDAIKKLESLLGFLIETLFFTNVWIYLYLTVLQIFRFLFPSRPNDNFLILGVNPEPFEIPLYLLTTFIIVLTVFILHTKTKHIVSTSRLSIRFLVFLFLVFIFIRTLGKYPLGELDLAASDFFFPAVYLLILLFIIFEIGILEKLIKTGVVKTAIFFIAIVLIVAFFTFPPRFSISGVDYSYFFGPIWEIAHGKTIYTEVTSQYGFLSILFFTVLYKFRILPFTDISVVVWILFLVQYFLCFYLVYKQSGSILFATLALFSILTVNFFTVGVIRTNYPQSGPLRWLPLVISLFILFKIKDIVSSRFISFIALLSFFVVDTGVELILSYTFTLFLLFITGAVPFKKTVQSVILLATTLIGSFVVIDMLHLLAGHHLIDIAAVFTKLKQYSQAGFGMIPIENHTYFWFEIFFYFGVIVYFFRKKSKTDGDAFLLFSANISLFASIYFIGRSTSQELYTISLLMLLNAFLLIGTYYRTILPDQKKILLFIIIFILFIVCPLYHRPQSFTQSIEIRLKQLQQGNIFVPEMDELLKKKYSQEQKMIQDSFKEEEILIVSGDDNYLYYLTGKHSLLTDNSLVTILTKQDLDFSLQKVARACPKKIVGECRLFKLCSNTQLYSKAFSSWQPIILHEVERRCNIKYVPIKCTDQLCIASAK